MHSGTDVRNPGTLQDVDRRTSLTIEIPILFIQRQSLPAEAFVFQLFGTRAYTKRYPREVVQDVGSQHWITQFVRSDASQPDSLRISEMRVPNEFGKIDRRGNGAPYKWLYCRGLARGIEGKVDDGVQVPDLGRQPFNDHLPVRASARWIIDDFAEQGLKALTPSRKRALRAPYNTSTRTRGARCPTDGRASCARE